GARRVGDDSEDGAGHGLRRDHCRKEQRDDHAKYRSSHLRPPCASHAARCDSMVPLSSSTAPKSIETARAAAMTAAAMSESTRSCGRRSIGPATLTAATTTPL